MAANVGEKDAYGAYSSVAPAIRDELTKEGVHGVRYRDAMSRDGKSDTRNYVVFDDSLIEMTHRNGVAIESKLRSLYEENGIHPSEVLADAAQDPTLAKRLAADDPLLPPEYTGVDPVALKAEQIAAAPETMREMPGVSPELSQTLARRMAWPETPNVNETAPAVKPRSLGAHIGGLLDRIGLGDVTRDLQMKITPMAARNATIEARATAKDWANSMRVVEFDKETLLKQLDKEFTPERRQAIFEAIDAEGVATWFVG